MLVSERDIELVISDNGDILLISISIKFNETLRECLIRHGYGEFLVLHPDLDNLQTFQDTVVRLRKP